nr:MopE-related protein [Acidobacteriota bacterium]
PPLAPTDTTCDGVDDNCDGLVDDGYLPLTTSCGVGVCERFGATSCVLGVVQDSCAPGLPLAPADVFCNGQDDDCSGEIDEDYEVQLTVCGVGTCAALGSILCEAGQLVEDCTPGEPSAEVCNYLDDDCDGSADNNIPVPAGPQQLSAERSPSSGSAILSWPAVPAALTYDVLRGRLPLLVTSGGDFSVATDLCLIDNVELTSWAAPDPPAPGDAYWYLVRASNCVGVGSYDAGENGLAAPRDASIAASPNACP